MYEVTVEVPNGDWQYRKLWMRDFHAACIYGVNMARELGGRLIRVERL